MMRTGRSSRRGVGLGLALLLAIPAAALAHAVVIPAVSTPGAYERYILRVPNEAGVATTRVQITFPAEVRVVSFAEVPGWSIEVQSDTSGRIVGAVWTGSLPPERFVEFPFMAVNPQTETSLVWPVVQTYADGFEVAWTGPEDSDRPASTTRIRPAGDTSAGVRWPGIVALIALGLSLVGFSRSRRGRGQA
ncbi:MAG TPA: YcnI family protein [Gemmatimonadaceae bacterium]